MPDFIPNSSYGEDAMLFGLLDRLKSINHIDMFAKNTYIDIGCYHPVYDNNTAFLYQLGWRGTLVDPNPALKAEVDKYRYLDLFLEVAVDTKTGIKEFMMFNDANSTNTLDKEFVEKLKRSSGQEIIKTLNVECVTLDYIFEKHIERFKSSPMILNIDIEGMDYDVISSYSFKYRPLFIIIEDDILGSFEGSKTKFFMESKNYAIVSANFLSGIYMDKETDLYKKIKKLGYYDELDG
jgi:FkbM family methyltransferase